MRTSTAYFAGVATVIIAIAAGLGGGLTIASVMSPMPPRPQATRLEQRTSPQPLPTSNRVDEQRAPQAPVPYVAASRAAAITAAPQSQTQTLAKTQGGTPASQPAPREKAAAIDDANARDSDKDANKARDANLKRQADKRKAGQQQWAGRRKKYDQQREQELRDAQAEMQDDDGPRDVVIRRGDYDQPARLELPRFNLFGAD